MLTLNENNFEFEKGPHELFLTTRPTTKTRNVNNMSIICLLIICQHI